MKTAIKLVLIYFVMQMVASVMILPFTASALLKGGSYDAGVWTSVALLLAIVLMTVYLWRAKWLKNDGWIYSLTTPMVLLLSMLAGVSTIFLEDFLMSRLSFLPDWMGQTFDAMQSGWVGIAGIALLGPVLEELLFRGAITKVLLQRYSPARAIVYSALVFGVFHLNPVQVVGATVAGLLFAWLYWRTGSIVPGVLVHIFNNSLSVYVDLAYPHVEASYLSELLSPACYYSLLILAVAVLVFSVKLLKNKTEVKV